MKTSTKYLYGFFLSVSIAVCVLLYNWSPQGFVENSDERQVENVLFLTLMVSFVGFYASRKYVPQSTRALAFLCVATIVATLAFRFYIGNYFLCASLFFACLSGVLYSKYRIFKSAEETST